MNKKVSFFILFLLFHHKNLRASNNTDGLNFILNKETSTTVSNEIYSEISNSIQIVKSKLPRIMSRSIPSPIKVIITDREKSDKKHLAEYNSWSKTITFYIGSFNNDREFNADLFQRTLIHELAHAYDLNSVNIDERSKDICLNYGEDSYQANLGICKQYISQKYSISDNPVYLNLAGWPIYSNGAMTKENAMKFRSPDQYELKNPQEHFAVNFEYFIFDKDYKCRKSSIYQFFKEKLEFDPYPETNCEIAYPIVNTGFSGNGFQYLDFKRLYSINYLQATEGTDVESKWGHSMLHLVFCSPERVEINSECNKDVNYHIVVSFAAFINSIEMNLWKGISGGYPSHVFLSPLYQAIELYNKVELRNLESYPLKINYKQKESIFKRIIEAHWGYDNKYYFLSNNCSVETYNLIWPFIKDQMGDEFMNSITTPNGLKQLLLESKIIPIKHIQNKSWAIENGLLFESYEKKYRAAWDLIGPYLNSEKLLSWKDYQKINFDRKEELFNQFKNTKSKNSFKLVAALYLLELNQMLSMKRHLYSQTIKEFLDNSKKQYPSYTTNIIKDVITTNFEFAYPAYFLKNSGGYGIPNKKESELGSMFYINTANKSKKLNEQIDHFTQSHTSTEQQSYLQKSLSFLNEIGSSLIKIKQQTNNNKKESL